MSKISAEHETRTKEVLDHLQTTEHKMSYARQFSTRYTALEHMTGVSCDYCGSNHWDDKSPNYG